MQYSRETVLIQTDKGVLYALPPVHRKDTTEFWLATAAGHGLPKDQAELLARTVAPHLFPAPEDEPWRKPVREIYKDLQETVQSYTRDLRAIQHPETEWSVQDVTLSLSALLQAIGGTLEMLEDLL